MLGRRFGCQLSFLVVASLLLLQQQGLVSSQKAKPWQTLSGDAPAVIANDGFSGLFPGSSYLAYSALSASSPAAIFWCDVQLTKDGVGLCLPDMKLDNCTNIVNVFQTGQTTYNVNSVPTTAWFSVDYTSTQMQSVSCCFSHIVKNNTIHGKPEIISHNGASGTYPECTDLAYQKAVQDGADFIDCSVQLTKDRVLVCMSSPNLLIATTVTTSPFSTLFSTIPEIQSTPGIFTFNLTWDDMQNSLKPLMVNPEIGYELVRNPLYKNSGNFMRLSDFLTYAKDKSLSGILISIENAAFFAERLGFNVTDAVIKALTDSGYANQTAQQVMIQSTNSAVLVTLKQQTKYKLLYKIDESIRDADDASITDIKQFADAVALDRQSIFPESLQFVTEQLPLVQKLQNSSLSVYVYVLRNEFVSQPWDFFSDPLVEINNYVQGAGVDGIITDFPGTARAYKSNSCSNLGNSTPVYMLPVEPGGLLQSLPSQSLPPALAPMPVLDGADVVEPPLPLAITPPATPPVTPPVTPPATPSSAPQCIPGSIFVSFTVILGSLLI